MKSILILLLLGAATVRATIIPVDLGPPRIVTWVFPTTYPVLDDGHTASLSVESNALAGTPVMGQTLILDYVFSDLLWVTETRLGGQFFAGALAHLNQDLPPGIPCYTSWMVRADGSAGPTLNFNQGGIIIIGPGRPSLSLGITYPDDDMLGTARAYSGMHFEVQLPDLAGVEITGIKMVFDGGYSSNWAIINSTPDTGSTIWLTLGSLAGLAVLGRKR